MRKYIPSQIEPKWQKKWREEGLCLTDLSDTKNKYYVLVELPYTSGDLHMGHWFTFTMGDILARFKKRQGFNVLFPNGFDAFGLPAENAAIKQGIHPRDWTYQNMERMREQFETLGTSIDWTKTMVACDPKYYKWNQWVFLKMFEQGLAYRGKLLSNWCPKDATVLANENVENGKCWRCGSEVVQKEIDQWFFKITVFADRLLWQDPPQADWPKPLRVGQNEWIGKSIGVTIKFGNIEVFTTRPDTIFGATFIVISPEYPLLADYIVKQQQAKIGKYLESAKKKSELERKESKIKTGVFTGSFVRNPLTNQDIPVWVADYVLAGYGTGAIMGVPAHDQRDLEFAKAQGLTVKQVIVPSDEATKTDGGIKTVAFESEGVLINSGEYSNLSSAEAREKISKYIVDNHLGKYQTNYHLHDWSISRQRYWGTPIPIIYCHKCSEISNIKYNNLPSAEQRSNINGVEYAIIPVPEKDLPVELPYKVDYTPKGKPPLATAEDWVNTECPKCGGPAKREVETMDTFVDSAWYFFRYLDPENDVEIFDKDVVKNWMPLEIYIGGPEHTLGHALYSRFFTMVFKELGLIHFDEYAKKRVHHGTILGPDGSRMSKSRGNVVNPDEEVKNYGADAIRLYLMFLGPFDIVTPWNPDGVNGVYHFLQRVWGLYDKVARGDSEEGVPAHDRRSEAIEDVRRETELAGPRANDLRMMHKTIKKVTEDIEAIKFNTAIAALMKWLNYLSKKGKVEKEEYKTFLLLLAPFAPHITEELWSFDAVYPERSRGTRDKQNWSIHQQSWPRADNKYLEQQEVAIAVQINGKVRDVLMIHKDQLSDRKVVENSAKKSPKVHKFLGNKVIKRIVYVPGKVINIVISD